MSLSSTLTFIASQIFNNGDEKNHGQGPADNKLPLFHALAVLQKTFYLPVTLTKESNFLLQKLEKK
jgi:hypothetical protein